MKACSSKIEWLKEIIAFANGDGGNLIIGVDDDGTVVGLKDDLAKHNGAIAKFKDEITNAISETVYPFPEYSFIHAVIEDKEILVVNVEPSNGKCYASYENKKFPVFYIRRGATTRIADHNEVQELVRSKSAIQSQTRSPFDGYRFSQE